MADRKARAVAHVHRHKDGSIWGKGQLRDGVMTGYWEWYRKDGSLMRSGSFEDGEQVGEWTTYDARGRVVKITIMQPKRMKTSGSAKRAKKTTARRQARAPAKLTSRRT
jgi:antitoxin component YwqK of YwqJK toxin-antitoxin module